MTRKSRGVVKIRGNDKVMVIQQHGHVGSEPANLAQLLSRLLHFLVPGIELILEFLRDFLEQLWWEDPQQSPCDVQGREDVTVLVRALCQELLLEFVSELQVRVLICTQRLLTYHCLHGTCVLS